MQMKKSAGHIIKVTMASIVTSLALSTSLVADSFTDRPWGLESAAGRCVVCHSLEKGGQFRVAPNLWDIVGAKKARDQEWYNYSPGLIEMGGTWTSDDLDLFLADANQFAPGSTKSIRVTDPEERAAIIDFLEELQD
jgi:cytochrome c